MYLLKARKAFTLAELLIGMFVISTMLIAIVPSLKIYLDMYIKSEEKNTGEVYNIAYDIQRNKSYAKKIEVSENNDYLQFFRSEDCVVEYKFIKESTSLTKNVTCPTEELLDLDNKFILSNVTKAEFIEGNGIIKLNITSKNENFPHNFVF